MFTFQANNFFQTQMKNKYLFYSTEKYSNLISITVRSLRKHIQILYGKKKGETGLGLERGKIHNTFQIKMNQI